MWLTAVIALLIGHTVTWHHLIYLFPLVLTVPSGDWIIADYRWIRIRDFLEIGMSETFFRKGWKNWKCQKSGGILKFLQNNGKSTEIWFSSHNFRFDQFLALWFSAMKKSHFSVISGVKTNSGSSRQSGLRTGPNREGSNSVPLKIFTGRFWQFVKPYL